MLPTSFRLAVLVLAGMAVLSAACGARGDSAARPASATIGVTTTTTPGAPDLGVFRNFRWPIADACLPVGDQLMPNAPRTYRGGVHEGVDFYGTDNCTSVENGTTIRAAKAGTVIRIDHDYQDLTEATLAAANARIAAGQANEPDVLDIFRGRQVWVDHGSGIVTRYAHTSEVLTSIRVGDHVEAGDVIAFVGDSGTPESLNGVSTEMHLHFELRVNESFLGRDLPADEVRTLYEHLFDGTEAP